MGRTIDYGNLMQQAMRGLVARVLRDVERNGLPGEHHFFITFDTTHPGVEMADWLRQRYSGNMTVVMQHWYDNLSVEDDRFHVTLNFGDHPEPLTIPFDAIQTFVDPSVEFGLRFESHEAEITAEDGEDADEEAPMLAIDPDEHEGSEEKRDAEIVSLDKFRK